MNTKESMQNAGSLTIFTALANGNIEVHVADAGIGIHPKDATHIFESFFTKKANGNGLGLSVVRDIIRIHKGTSSIQSTPGRGTTFIIRLPIYKPQ